MTKPSRAAAYRCTECGATSLRWVGRCPECQAWGTVAEAGGAPVKAVKPGPVQRPARPIGELKRRQARAPAALVARLQESARRG